MVKLCLTAKTWDYFLTAFWAFVVCLSPSSLVALQTMGLWCTGLGASLSRQIWVLFMQEQL